VGGPLQCGRAVGLRRVDIDALPEQRLRGAGIAALDGIDEPEIPAGLRDNGGGTEKDNQSERDRTPGVHINPLLWEGRGTTIINDLAHVVIDDLVIVN
jgi:hypothetical protein